MPDVKVLYYRQKDASNKTLIAFRKKINHDSDSRLRAR